MSLGDFVDAWSAHRIPGIREGVPDVLSTHAPQDYILQLYQLHLISLLYTVAGTLLCHS